MKINNAKATFTDAVHDTRIERGHKCGERRGEKRN
jgi:hypothetical protein